MTLSINTNISALTAQRNLQESSARSESSIAKLSSGSRITNASDDAAALAISSGLKLDLASLRAAGDNVSQASSILQIADGGLEQIGEVLNRAQTLASTSQSDQISDTERSFLDTEFQSLLSEIDRIADSTEFNGIELLGGKDLLDLSVNGSGANSIESAQGFVGFNADSAIRENGESFEITFDDSTNVFSVQVFDANGGSGSGDLVASESVNLEDLSGDPFDLGGTDSLGEGETFELNFASIGLDVTVNSDFDATSANGGDFATGGIDITGSSGTGAATLDFLVGVDTSDTISSTLQVATADELGVGSSSVDTDTNALNASDAINSAVETINTARADLGASLNRLEFAGSNVGVQIENSEAARSILEDVDISEEFTNFTSAQTLVQAGVSILSQANQQPSLLLQLLN